MKIQSVILQLFNAFRQSSINRWSSGMQTCLKMRVDCVQHSEFIFHYSDVLLPQLHCDRKKITCCDNVHTYYSVYFNLYHMRIGYLNLCIMELLALL
jgi:hypothetical protein